MFAKTPQLAPMNSATRVRNRVLFVRFDFHISIFGQWHRKRERAVCLCIHITFVNFAPTQQTKI
jgi:putative hemolysin